MWCNIHFIVPHNNQPVNLLQTSTTKKSSMDKRFLWTIATATWVCTRAIAGQWYHTTEEQLLQDIQTNVCIGLSVVIYQCQFVCLKMPYYLIKICQRMRSVSAAEANSGWQLQWHLYYVIWAINRQGPSQIFHIQQLLWFLALLRSSQAKSGQHLWLHCIHEVYQCGLEVHLRGSLQKGL